MIVSKIEHDDRTGACTLSIQVDGKFILPTHEGIIGFKSENEELFYKLDHILDAYEAYYDLFC